MRSKMLSLAARLLPDAVFARVHVLGKLGYWPDLKNPRTFSERLQAKKLFDRDPLIPLSADKYTVRDLVTSELGSEFLPELFSVAESADQVDVTTLPKAYVMKGSHGSGMNRLVANGELTNEEARTLAAQWLARSFYWKRREWAYRPLTPRVLFEENLAPGGQIDDIKFFTFGGVPRLVQVDRDRHTNHARALFDTEWRKLDVVYDHPHPREPIPAPQQLDEMLNVAQRIGRHFGFARIDLYALPERIVVGEVTHYPDGGAVRFVPNGFDAELGAVWGEGRAIDEAFLVR